MKIVQIEDFFHPDAGYQINILSKYLTKFGHDVTIITSKMDLVPVSLASFFGKDDIDTKDACYTKLTGVKILRLPIKSYTSGRAVFKKDIFEKIRELDPDIIFAHGSDSFISMRILKKRRKIGKALVFDNHMLKMASKNKLSPLFHLFYKMFYAPIFKKENYYVIRTQNDNYVEKYLGVPIKQCPWISYGSDLLLFHKDKIVREEFRKNNKIGNDDFVVLYAGKLDESKGGMLLAKAFKKKFDTKRKVVLVCVGKTSGEYGKTIDEIFGESENRIIRYSTQKYVDLPKFFQMADLCVFPKQCSLSFYDAQACGLPVLSENNNINVERCSHNNGWNFISDNISDFRSKIECVCNMPINEYSQFSMNALDYIHENYNYEIKAREYESILLDSYNKFANKVK